MHIFIYPFILYRLFYFISFYSILLYLLSFIDDQNFFITFFFIYFVIICPVPGCSGMFRNVPGRSGMFHVPGFVNARSDRHRQGTTKEQVCRSKMLLL